MNNNSNNNNISGSNTITPNPNNNINAKQLPRLVLHQQHPTDPAEEVKSSSKSASIQFSSASSQ